MDCLTAYDLLSCSVCMPLPDDDDLLTWSTFVARLERQAVPADHRPPVRYIDGVARTWRRRSTDPTREDQLSDILCDLGRLSVEDIPELELLLLGSLDDFIGSPASQADADGKRTAAGLLTACYSAVSTTRGISGLRNDAEGPDVDEVRQAVARGAHLVASEGLAGLERIAAPMMSAAPELIESSASKDELTYQTAVFFLAQLATVASDQPAEQLIETLAEILPAP